MPKYKKRRLKEDRQRARDTLYERYGKDYFSKIRKKAHRDPTQLKLQSWRYHKPERFNEDGTMKSEYVDEFKEKVIMKGQHND